MTCITTRLVSALALSACVSGAALAATPMRNQITVTYTDLDISRPAGAQILLARIKMAAHSVCGGSSDLRDLGAFSRQRACVKDSVENAIRAARSPLVTKLYGAPQLYVGESRFDIAAK